MRAAFLTVTLAVLATAAAATYGGDISEYYDASTFRCTIQNGWSFVSVRSYCSYGGVDSNAPATLRQAIAAGLPYHDVYHFPCRSQDPTSQVRSDFDQVNGLFGMMWFDIETNPSPGCGWSGDLASNCAFLGELIDAAHGLGIHTGVYASEYMWGRIMGDSCHVGADKASPLWYAHYDHRPSFSDFQPFGGWSKPNVKQYWDGVGYCGINADADWYP